GGSAPWRSRCPGTPRRAAARPRRCAEASPAANEPSWSCDEGHAVLADLHLVALPQRRALDALAVDEGAVERALVLDDVGAVAFDQHRVAARDGDVVQKDLAFGRAADPRALAGRAEALARAAAAGPHDEGRPLAP